MDFWDRDLNPRLLWAGRLGISGVSGHVCVFSRTRSRAHWDSNVSVAEAILRETRTR